jgi:hypothetical protein
VASPNRFRVTHKPTKSADLGNWAVVNRNTGRIIARKGSRDAAQRFAASRGSAVRRSRRSRGRTP